jgi:hypothetical protein
MTETTSAERRLELIATVLLALGTVATAWAASQSRQWTGVHCDLVATLPTQLTI